MILIALFFLLRPFFRLESRKQGDQIEPMLDVYRSRLNEIKTEVETGLLSDTEAVLAENELNQTLLNEVDENQITRTTKSGSHEWWAAGVMLVLLPVITISIYMIVGNPHLVDTVLQQHTAAQDDSGTHPFSIEEMVDQLAIRLANQPDDPQGWLMLTNSYMTLGRYQDAAEAAGHLYALHGNDPYVMLRYADVLATANGNRMSGKPAELVQKALALEPENITGLWLAGMAEDEQGNHHAAIEYWLRLLPLLEDDPDSFEEVQILIGRAQGKLGESQKVTVITDTNPATTDNPRSIIVNVSLSPDFANDTHPDDVLFVYAKAVEGPPMPLAVVRETVKNLPLQVTMDDSLAMFPGMKLSDYEQIQISARISKSGNAIPQPGDFVGETPTITLNQTDSATVIINKQVH
jgi:cytochrome c-type biogenesis protein CcmH